MKQVPFLIFVFLFVLTGFVNLGVQISNAQICVQPLNGLISHWPCDFSASDATGSHSGMMVNGVLIEPNGLVNAALSFDGVDDYVEISHTPEIDMGAGQDFTIEGWVKVEPGAMADLAGVVAMKHDAGNSKGYVFLVKNTGEVAFDISDGAPYYSVSGGDVNDGQWHHIAGLREGMNINVYIDGQLVDSMSASSNSLENNDPLTFGTYYDHPTIRRFTGLIDDLSLYNRALLPGEIQSIVEAGAYGKCLPAPTPNPSFNSDWMAASGYFPDGFCSQWLPIDTEPDAYPEMTGGALRLTTLNDLGTAMAYQQEGSDIVINYPLIIETQMRFVDGQSIHTARSCAAIGIEVEPDVWNNVTIGQDEIFLLSDNVSRGAVAMVDTDDSFHTYRIEVQSDGSIRVFYDGEFVLSGSVFSHWNGQDVQRIWWGDGTSKSLGTTEWRFFHHNANAGICEPPTGSVTGYVLADCPSAETPILGVTVDAFDLDGVLFDYGISDENGYFEILDLPTGDYTVTLVTPLGYNVDSQNIPITVVGDQLSPVDFSVSCLEAIGNPRGNGFWKHQVGVATGGRGHAHIDAATMCVYLDLIEGHFNSNAINQVLVYEPAVGASCEDKLLVAKGLLNLRGHQEMIARARQHLMTSLLNVSAGYLSLNSDASEDGATISQAITFCDNLIDDEEFGDHELAKDIAETINKGRLVDAGVIPLDIVNIAYRIPGLTAQGYVLDPNQPNPFNPSTKISYSIPGDEFVSLVIYSLDGRVVKTLVSEPQSMGRYEVIWNGVDNSGRRVASGTYLYGLKAGGFTELKKMTLVK